MSAQLRGRHGTQEWQRASIEPVRFDVGDLDWSIRPQDDLDGFVNARWRREHPLPAGHACWDSFTILQERSLRQQALLADAAARGEFGHDAAARVVGDFWQSGLDERNAAHGVAVLLDDFARIDAIDGRDALVGYLHEDLARGGDALFRIAVQPDCEDPDRQSAFVTAREPALRDPALFGDESAAAERLRAAYLDYGASLLARAGVGDAMATMAAVFRAERELASALPSRRAARDVALAHQPVDVAGARRIAPMFGWGQFFAACGANVERFSLAPPRYHENADRLLRQLPLPLWRALLRLRVADDAAAHLDASWRELHERFHGIALRGRRAGPPQWKHVLTTIEANAGAALGRLYAQRYGSASVHRRVRGLFESLREALRARLERAAWLGASTRALALDKLARMRAKIGHPEAWPEDERPSTARHSLYRNVVAARLCNRRRDLRRVGAATDADAWSLTPQTVNSRYDPQRNEILVPDALLQPPFLSDDGDPAQLYGGLGAVVAHEMTHAFDDQGCRFDARGRLRDWWTREDRTRFTALADRMRAAADDWRNADGERVDGALTLGENIADFGGLAVAWDAFEAFTHADADTGPDHFDRRQRFFLHWATLWRQNLSPDERRLRARIDHHAPANLRANAAAADLPAFAETFGCADGDRMHRAERVGIW